LHLAALDFFDVINIGLISSIAREWKYSLLPIQQRNIAATLQKYFIARL